MKKAIITTLVVLGLGTSVMAFAKHGGNFNKHKNSIFHIVDKLDLTENQEYQIYKLKKAKKLSMKAKRKEFKKGMKHHKKTDMNLFMTKNSFDKKAFKIQLEKNYSLKMDKMQKRKTNMINNKADTMEKVFNILTPQQRQKMIELSTKKKS